MPVSDHERAMALAVALAAFDETPCSIASLFEACERQDFTGAVTMHFRNGRPWCVELGRPVRVPLDVRRSVPRGTD